MRKVILVFVLVMAGCMSEGDAAYDDVASQESAVESAPLPTEDMRIVRDACDHACDAQARRCMAECPNAVDWCVGGCDGDGDICHGTCRRIWGDGLLSSGDTSNESALPPDWTDTSDVSTLELCHRGCDAGRGGSACHAGCDAWADSSENDLMNQGNNPGACCRAAYGMCHRYSGRFSRDNEVMCLVDLSDCLLLGNPYGRCEMAG